MGLALILSTLIFYFSYNAIINITGTALNNIQSVFLLIVWIASFIVIFKIRKEIKLKNIARNQIKIEKYKEKYKKENNQ